MASVCMRRLREHEGRLLGEPLHVGNSEHLMAYTSMSTSDPHLCTISQS